jgi:choline-glycine betaine transporter
MKPKARLDSVFVLSVAITGVVLLWGVIGPKHLEAASSKALSWIISNLGGF